MSFPRRKCVEITLELLDFINDKGEATRWDLVKIVGTHSQFSRYVSDYLIGYDFVTERIENNHYFYKLTKSGKDFHTLLKKANIFRGFLAISGRTLRSEKLDKKF